MYKTHSPKGGITRLAIEESSTVGKSGADMRGVSQQVKGVIEFQPDVRAARMLNYLANIR